MKTVSPSYSILPLPGSSDLTQPVVFCDFWSLASWCVGSCSLADKHSTCSARTSASLFLQQKTLEIDSGNLIFARVQHIYATLLLCTALCQRGQKDATGFYSEIRSA